MRRRLRRIGGFVSASLLVAAGLTTTATPALAGQEPIAIDEIDTSAYPLIELTVTAPPSLVGFDVPTSDWRLLEAGSARTLTAKPLEQEAISVLLVMDTSGSMAGQPLIQAKNAAVQFLDQLPPGTSTAVIGFGDTPQVKVGYTTDLNDAAVAIDSLTAQGETALYDAVALAASVLDGAPGDRKGVVLLTDGGDTVSSIELEEATLTLSKTDVNNFSAIELITDESDRGALEFFKAATSGQIVGADDPGALTGAYTQIANGLKNQYRLSYRSVTDEVDTTVDIIIDSEGTEARGSAEVALPPIAARPTVEDTAPTDEVADLAPVAAVVEAPGLLGRSWAFWVGIALVAIALAVGGAVLFAPRLTTRSLKTDAEVTASEDFDLLSGVTERAGVFSERILERTGALPTLDRSLDQAGVDLRPGELVAMVAAAAVFGGAIATIAGGPIAGIFVAALPLIITPLVLSYRRSRRQQAFADQLADTLLLFSSTLRAGYGLPQAIDTVATESPEPTASEFAQVVLEARLGRPVDTSLELLGQRMRSDDFGWVVDAVRIQRDVGGNLAEVLDHIEETIRARARIRRQVRALTAEGRLSAIVLLALPFGIGGIIYFSNPEYIEPLFDETAGRIMLGVGLGLIAAGAYWLKKLVEPEF